MLHTATLLFLEQLRTPLLTDVAVSITALGSVSVAALLIVLFYSVGLREEAVLSLAAAVLGGGAAAVLKAVVARPRPTVVDPVISSSLHTAAFPSGHTTLAFALAAVLAQEVDGSQYYFYGIAGLVAVSRLYLGLHWPGDVVAGAVLGAAAGLLVHRHRDRILAAAPGV